MLPSNRTIPKPSSSSSRSRNMQRASKASCVVLILAAAVSVVSVIQERPTNLDALFTYVPEAIYGFIFLMGFRALDVIIFGFLAYGMGKLGRGDHPFGNAVTAPFIVSGCASLLKALCAYSAPIIFWNLQLPLYLESTIDVSAIALGTFLLCLSWTFRYASDLQEDNDGIV